MGGFVFWTKNVAPFMRHLPEVRAFGFPFVVQHTINRTAIERAMSRPFSGSSQ